MNPTLSGAQHGRVRPWREVPGGIALDSETQGFIVRPCALRTVKESFVYTCSDYARQYLSSRGDQKYLPAQLTVWTQFFLLHHAIIEVPQTPDAPHVPMFPLPPTLTDATGAMCRATGRSVVCRSSRISTLISSEAGADTRALLADTRLMVLFRRWRGLRTARAWVVVLSSPNEHAFFVGCMRAI